MVGLAGVVGSWPSLEIDRHLRWSTRELRSRFEEGSVEILASEHPHRHCKLPVVDENSGTYVWLLGEVHGVTQDEKSDRGYQPRPPSKDGATFCAELYSEFGLECLSRLNGTFLLIVYDSVERQLSIATDRLGSFPLFLAEIDDGVAFSTNIQTLCCHPAIEPEFETGYLHEYLVFKRSFGISTPIKGIRRHQPGAISQIDVTTGHREVDSYWTPEYDPFDSPFSSFTDRFVERFRSTMEDWIDDEYNSYGLFLSGGSDSRLCLGGLAPAVDVTALHMSGWMSREARMAERAALTADVEFRWLRRGAEYQREALKRNPRLANFNGWFSQAYATGFSEEFIDDFDILVSGMYADTLFKGHALPTPTVDLGRVGEFGLPMEKSISSIEGYIDWMISGVSDELDLPTDLRTVLEKNIIRDGDEILHHGVRYPSLSDMVHCSKWYPLSNDDDMLFWNSLHQMRPYRTPYLDYRMIDLALEMPRRFQLRRNVIDRALERIAPELAEIPHSHTGIKPTRSFPVEYLGRVGNAFWQKHIRSESPPRRFHSNGPWVDDAELIRVDEFVREALENNQTVIESLPFLDWRNVMNCYERHLSGENRIVELYGLLTVLEMPVTTKIATTDTQSTNHNRRSNQDPPVIQQSLAAGDADE